jgi:hypothetical protein
VLALSGFHSPPLSLVKLTRTQSFIDVGNFRIEERVLAANRTTAGLGNHRRD